MVILCIAGAYLSEGSLFAVWLIIIFGVVGYLMRKLDFPYVTFIIGFILGPLLEASMNRMLVISGNNPLILFTKPISSGDYDHSDHFAGLLRAPFAWAKGPFVGLGACL